jgi:hypothetical protein
VRPYKEGWKEGKKNKRTKEQQNKSHPFNCPYSTPKGRKFAIVYGINSFPIWYSPNCSSGFSIKLRFVLNIVFILRIFHDKNFTEKGI